VLESNGTESEVIKILLRDARLWGWLSTLFEDQTATLKILQGSYESKNRTVLHEQGKDKTEQEIQAFAEEMNTLVKQVLKACRIG
jgi:hypothetical protein